MSTALEDMEFSRAGFSGAFGGADTDLAIGALPFPAIRPDTIAAVEVTTSAHVARCTVQLPGMTVEIIDVTGRERVDIRLRSSAHLLVVHEQGDRIAGETSVESAPSSAQRELSRKLTFVPAGGVYHEWMKGGSYPRTIYFHIDPAKLAADGGGTGDASGPRLLFENAALLETALKFRESLESAGTVRRDRHLAALGVVLTCELQQVLAKAPRTPTLARGGLASWQQRVVAKHIDENLGERISITALAALVHLSPYHFCRAFKQSFGQPPHRYHIGRRILRAKALLESAEYSVTDIGMTLGFSETSSFCTAFRKATGLTPTAYHRQSA